MFCSMTRRRRVHRHSTDRIATDGIATDGIGRRLPRMIAVIMCVNMFRMTVSRGVRVAAAASARFSGTGDVLRSHVRLQLLRKLPWGGIYGP
jgi:hypothetical protein